ncbi:hypothetical protein VTJ49DRAFT_5691 [Mycothermus thermophilus]|uniref:Uncharacterized protein n=1 Tax=Humicola insolens TaxID=85995 RepID=A0ABR3V2K8_HUMIN
MEASKVLAVEVTDFTDEDLDEYFTKHGRLINVRDPENLPPSFIERLRGRARNQSPTLLSRPVDLDKVSAQLEKVATDRRKPDWEVYSIGGQTYRYCGRMYGGTDIVLSGSTFSTPSSLGCRSPEDPYLTNLRLEREAHDKLVNEGGRPWYPIHRLEKIAEHPERHRHLLRYFQEGDHQNCEALTVFGTQLLRWRGFRVWQMKRRNEFQGRIDEYTAWAKRFLKKRCSYPVPVDFDFDEDLERQHPLTQWIEYLTYEYNFLHTRYSWHLRRTRWYRAQWKALVDSGVLKPHETEDFLLQWEPCLERCAEKERAERAVELALQAVEQGARGDPSAAQARLHEAQERLAAVKRRTGLIFNYIQKTFAYREARRFSQRHEILLQWVKGQLDMILREELEKKAEDNPPCSILEEHKVVPSITVARNDDDETEEKGAGQPEPSSSPDQQQDTVSTTQQAPPTAACRLEDSGSLKRTRDDDADALADRTTPLKRLKCGS